MSEKILKFKYLFEFEGAANLEYKLDFKDSTMDLIEDKSIDPPDWALLETDKCTNCTLKEEDYKYCPVAKNMSKVVEDFKSYKSIDKATITVEAPERTYKKTTTLQEGIYGILGLIMSTSGCPVMNSFKPLARFHLPFPTGREAVLRLFSFFLFQQYIKNDKKIDVSVLEKLQENVAVVNRHMLKRLRRFVKGDANLNSLTHLDSYFLVLVQEIETDFSEFENIF